jgi:L-rhamnose-H+ transport protein
MIALGVFLHAIGGFGAGSFYIAFKKVKNWQWESYWLVNGLFTWVIMPWLLMFFTVPHLDAIFRELPWSSVFWTFSFGVLWGIGNLTFGLTLRYLGISLGMAVALGITVVIGTLVPPIYKGEFGQLLQNASGLITLSALGVCVLGIVVCGRAGMSKENELTAEEKQKYIQDFDFKKGMLIALLSGIMSACFAFSVHAAQPIADLAEKHGTPEIWKNNLGLVVIMTGCLITNAGGCLILNFRNRSYGDYFNGGGASLTTNYVFCALAGIMGFSEFMFYTMGTTQMGKYDFASWTIHLAMVIFFSNLWGLITHEWKGCSPRTLRQLFTGLILLLLTGVLIGVGNYMVPSQ